MDIPNDKILKLKCSECDCFLSRIPIYVKEDGSAICGRCPIPLSESQNTKESESEEEQIKVFRMKPFEDLIENIKFPCMYQNNGCTEEIISLNLQNHEENCKFRPYVCSILPSGTCSWIGCQDKFYEHCQAEHTAQILQHPCVFEHNITENSTETYITKVFNILFLIHTKVCLSTHKIYHSVHCFENAVSTMYFKLVVRKGHKKIVKRGKIEPLGCRTIKENLSVSCGINSLIEILDGYEKTNFTIKIICTTSCKICNLICNELVEDSYCQECGKRTVVCKYSYIGCTYKDIDVKKSVHESWLCRFTNWCWICMVHLEISPTLTKHYEIVHKEAIFNEQVFWNITKGMFTKNQFDFIIVSKYDKFYCTFFVPNCLIEVCSSTLNTAKLSKFKCVVSIKNNAEIKEVNLAFNVNHKIDWCDSFPTNYLFANNSSYQVKVDILKND